MGDAAGATLEFLGRVPTESDVKTAMQMVGGGVFRLAPGQITDDGELTLSLARALAAHGFDEEQIARNHASWVDSMPFDIGNTTRSSLGAGVYLLSSPREDQSVSAAIRAAAQSRCMGSKANGSLMRCTPMGVWGHRLTSEQLGNYARRESQLSHPHPSCCDAVACYSIAIGSLVSQPGDRQRAWQSVNKWADQNANEEVQQWLAIAEDGLEVPFHPQVGFVKIAFVHAFRHLIAGNDYESALRETLAGGGDSDTNACIVGGLVGAAVGLNEIPASMVNAVVHCDTSRGTKPRPQAYSTADIALLVKQLLHSVP